MLRSIIFFGLFLFSFSLQSQITLEYQEDRSMLIKRGWKEALNKNTNLKRQMVLFQDSTCPLRPMQISVRPIYSDPGLYYKAVGLIKAKENIEAWEMRIYLFDVFGNFMEMLQHRSVRRFDVGQTIALDRTFWNSLERWQAEGFYMAAIAITTVRTSDGKVWRQDLSKVDKELEKLKLNPPKDIDDLFINRDAR